MSPGQIAYEAYLNFSGGNSLVTGAKLPEWPEAAPKIKLAWEHAAWAVLESDYCGELPPKES